MEQRIITDRPLGEPEVPEGTFFAVVHGGATWGPFRNGFVATLWMVDMGFTDGGYTIEMSVPVLTVPATNPSPNAPDLGSGRQGDDG